MRGGEDGWGGVHGGEGLDGSPVEDPVGAVGAEDFDERAVGWVDAACGGGFVNDAADILGRRGGNCGRGDIVRHRGMAMGGRVLVRDGRSSRRRRGFILARVPVTLPCDESPTLVYHFSHNLTLGRIYFPSALL